MREASMHGGLKSRGGREIALCRGCTDEKKATLESALSLCFIGGAGTGIEQSRMKPCEY
jgi:hypothetical protein